MRNAYDLKAVSMPEKFYSMQDFHEYYSGARTAPYLTIFIGGNHEASNYMWELYYGGWAAPNIYYMGAANVIHLGPIRIAGLSGIWKGFDYKKPHYERLPYNGSDVKSIYHVRELDTRKLLLIESQVDIGLSHDWPRGVEWKGDHRQLFRFKPYFEQEANDGTLGSVAAAKAMEHLRPPYWFSAHMHCRFAAEWVHEQASEPVPPINPDAIDLDSDSDEDADGSDEVEKREQASDKKIVEKSNGEPSTDTHSQGITNNVTQFLALDKCLPNKHFLQLLEVEPHSTTTTNIQRPLGLEYDEEWLAITRLFAKDLQVGDPDAVVPIDRGEAVYRPEIEQEVDWVKEHVVKPGKMRNWLKK